MLKNTRFRMHWWVILAAVVCVTRASLAAEPAVNLQPRWHAGEQATYRFDTVRKQHITMSMGGHSRQAHTTIKVAGVVVWKVNHVADDGSASCTLTRKWMSATLIGPHGKKQVNDTRSGTANTPPIYNALQTLTQNPIHVTLAADGSVTNMTGLNVIKQQIKMKQLAPTKRSIKRFVTLLLPIAKAPKRAHVGTSWQYRFANRTRTGMMHFNVRYRLKSLQKIAGIPVATIEGRGRMRYNFDRSKLPPQAPPINVSLRHGSFHTQIMFDLSRHETVGRHTFETRTMRMTVQIPNHTLERDMTQTVDQEVIRISQK